MDDGITTGEDGHPEKSAFTSDAVPDRESGEEPSLGLYGLDHYKYDKNDPPATTREVYSYYAYYAANNGIGSFQ